MVNSHTRDQENLVDTKTYPQISEIPLPVDVAAHMPLLAENSRSFSHPPLFTVADGTAFRDGLPGMATKNLFLKDKKETLWLVTAAQQTVIDLTAFSTFLRERRRAASRLSFGSPALLFDVLRITPGSVTPLALLHDSGARVNVAFDAALMRAPLISCHPLRNDMTTVMAPAILRRVVENMGYRPLIVDFLVPKPMSVEMPML